MKAFTDLDQSLKLAEILPLESADMHWQYIEEDDGQLQWFCFPKDFSINKHNMVSAWSLSALFDILPLEIDLHKQSDRNIECYYMEYTTRKTYFATKRYTNPIDVAFEMVCWLKN